MERTDIRNYGKIRTILRHIYRFGYFTREDFAEDSPAGSPSSYDKTIRQLKELYYLDEPFYPPVIIERKNQSLKSYRYKRDYFERSDSQLIATYGLYTLSDDAVCDIICSLSCITGSCGIGAVEINHTFQLTGLGGESEGDLESVRSYPTLCRRLTELLENGYLLQGNEAGKKAFYTSSIMGELSDEDLLFLYYLSDFYSGAGYPRVAASFLRDALLRHILFRNMEPPPHAFLFRDNACGSIFDEAVVQTLLHCCMEHKQADIVYKKKSMVVHPVLLRIDTKLGRWYLLAVSEGKPTILRVEGIETVKAQKSTFDYESDLEAVRRWSAHKYLSAPQGDSADREPVLVEAELKFQTEALRIQFERELIIGHIETRGDGREYFCALIDDPIELKPLLRSYGPFLRILPSEMHTLAEDVRSEYERMLNQYGAV